MPLSCPSISSDKKSPLTKVIKVVSLTCASLMLGAANAWANSITTIDLRNGITEEKVAQYHRAVLGGSNEGSAKLIKLLISADKGFDAGWLTVPRQRRILRVNVVIYTFRGSVISAPIRVNLYKLNSQSIKHINLEVSLR